MFATLTREKGDDVGDELSELDSVLEVPEPTVTVWVTVSVDGGGGPGAGVRGLKSDPATAAIPPAASTSPSARDILRNRLLGFSRALSTPVS
jgi:hypothetical protein